jgi:UDP-hydrolysing UDP-N-acetyl-D-glucosamine 2-epimerase
MDQLSALLDALDAADRPVVFTYPNADPLGRKIIAAIEQFVETHARCRVVPNLGTRAYFSLMNHAAAMAGNSSSGIIEAASFKLPVVNIGSRQGGRVRAANVIDVNPVADEISRAIADAVSPEFRAGLDELANPYGDGHAAPRIVEVLANAALGPTLTIKRFKDLDVAR